MIPRPALIAAIPAGIIVIIIGTGLLAGRWLAAMSRVRDRLDAQVPPTGTLDVDDALAVAATAQAGYCPPRPLSPVVSTRVKYGCGCVREIDHVGTITGARYCWRHDPWRRWESQLAERDEAGQ